MKRIGTAMALRDTERTRLLKQLTYWKDRQSPTLRSDRAASEALFTNTWDNQSPDGLLHDTAEFAAAPFDSSSDQRLRWGETAFKDLSALYLNALVAADVRITCTGDADSERRAAAIGALLRGLISSMGSRWLSAILELIHHMVVDTPAIALATVRWRRERTLGVERTTTDKALGDFVPWIVAAGAASDDDGQAVPPSEEEAMAVFWDEIKSAREDGEVVRWLVSSQHVSPGLAPRVVRALSEDGECEYARAAEVVEGPVVKALRYGDDFIIPRLTKSGEGASVVFRNEWTTEAELWNRVETEDWSESWVRDLLGHPGENFYDAETIADEDDRKDQFDLVWCYTTERGRDGTIRRYEVVLSFPDGSAFGKRLARNRRGRHGLVLFRDHVVSENAVDGRGLAETSGPAEGVAKVIRDGCANNGIVAALPPVKAKGSRLRNTVIEPFRVVQMGVNDDLAFMQPPAYSAADANESAAIRSDMLANIGLSDGKSDMSGRQSAMVSWFLSQMCDLYRLLIETAQDEASDEFLARVSNERDIEGLKRADIAGGFGISLDIDLKDLNGEQLTQKITAIAQLFPALNRNGAIDTLPVAMELLRHLVPSVSRSAYRPQEALAGEDLKDERQNFVQLKAGLMPEMNVKGGWNYAVRLQFWERLMAENPQALAEFTPEARENAEQWIQALRAQDRQYGENAEIGKTGSAAVPAEA